MKQLAPSDLTELESMIDRTSLAEVLRGLRDTCDAKAAHLAEAWQDNASAALWSKAAVQVGNLVERPAVTRVSE